jgi:hypothetical protein
MTSIDTIATLTAFAAANSPTVAAARHAGTLTTSPAVTGTYRTRTGSMYNLVDVDDDNYQDVHFDGDQTLVVRNGEPWMVADMMLVINTDTANYLAGIGRMLHSGATNMPFLTTKLVAQP